MTGNVITLNFRTSVPGKGNNKETQKASYRVGSNISIQKLVKVLNPKYIKNYFESIRKTLTLRKIEKRFQWALQKKENPNRK